jgi:hypothetical protein
VNTKHYRASDGTRVDVTWMPVKGPKPGVKDVRVHANGAAVEADARLPDGRRLTVRWPDYGDPDVILEGRMLEGSASHPLTIIGRARGALAFGAVLLAMFAMGAHGPAIVIQVASAIALAACAAVTKPAPRVALGASLVVILALPILLLWIAGVRPLAAAARALAGPSGE